MDIEIMTKITEVIERSCHPVRWIFPYLISFNVDVISDTATPLGLMLLIRLPVYIFIEASVSTYTSLGSMLSSLLMMFKYLFRWSILPIRNIVFSG